MGALPPPHNCLVSVGTTNPPPPLASHDNKCQLNDQINVHLREVEGKRGEGEGKRGGRGEKRGGEGKVEAGER
jgi:hypothetical protein